MHKPPATRPHCLKCLNPLELDKYFQPVACPCNWRKKRRFPSLRGKKINCPHCRNALTIVHGTTLPCVKCFDSNIAKPIVTPFAPAGIEAGNCRYCGLPLRKRKTVTQFPDTHTDDHFIPQAEGGTLDKSNKVKACPKCNAWKGAFSPFKMLELWNEIDPQGLAEAYLKLRDS